MRAATITIHAECGTAIIVTRDSLGRVIFLAGKNTRPVTAHVAWVLGQACLDGVTLLEVRARYYLSLETAARLGAFLTSGSHVSNVQRKNERQS